MNELTHHGIKGQRWGVRRYQNPDGSLTAAGRRRLAAIERKDTRWANRNYNRIYKSTYKASKKEMQNYVNTDLRRSGKTGKHLINEYNKKLTEVMNKNVSDIQAPSGKVIQFVAKRGEVGVHMALADRGYDMTQLKNGVYSTGKVAYKKKIVDMT